MGFFVNEEHYVNFINKINKEKFGTKLKNKHIELFRNIYSIKYYNALFSSFGLNSLPEVVSWEFRELRSKKELKKFYASKIKVLREVKLFIKNPEKLVTNKCKTFLNYCKRENVFINKIIKSRLSEFKYKCNNAHFSKKTTKILESLLMMAGLYFIFDGKKKLSYIGKSYDLGNRIIGSIEERKGYYFSYIKTKSRIDADILEPYMIWLKKPPLNSEFVTNDKPSFKLKIPRMSRMIKVYK